MRILMISDHADPLAEMGAMESGGQNIFVYYLAKHLSESGVEVDVFTRWNRATKKEIEQVNDNFRVIRVKAGPRFDIPRDAFLTILPEFRDNILKYVKREGQMYDYIHTNYWFSGLAGLEIAKVLALPIYHVYHSIGQIRYNTLKEFKPQDADSIFYAKRLASEKKIAREATGIISTSPVEKELIHNLFGIPKSKITVITIGVDTDIFYPIETGRARRKLRLSDDPIVLYVGRLEWRKGIGTLLYAFQTILKQHPRARLLIVGGGRTSNEKAMDEQELLRLQDMAKELGIMPHVSFLGAKDQSQLVNYYSAADVTVVPSYYEPFGIVPLESMATGTPVVASRTGGLQYSVVEGITGELASPRNPVDLAEKISTVLTKGKPHYSIACLLRIKRHFLWDTIAKQYTQLAQITKKNDENRHLSAI